MKYNNFINIHIFLLILKIILYIKLITMLMKDKMSSKYIKNIPQLKKNFKRKVLFSFIDLPEHKNDI